MDQFEAYGKETSAQIFDETTFLVWKLLHYAYAPIQDDPPVPVVFGNSGEELLWALSVPALAYAKHRFWNGSYDPLTKQSTLSLDLASLMAEIATPGRVFVRECKDIAASIAACLMQYEGCELKKPQQFDNGIQSTSFEGVPHPAQVDEGFRGLLEKCWQYTGHVQMTMFENVRVWRELERANDLTRTVEELVPRE